MGRKFPALFDSISFKHRCWLCRRNLALIRAVQCCSTWGQHTAHSTPFRTNASATSLAIRSGLLSHTENGTNGRRGRRDERVCCRAHRFACCAPSIRRNRQRLLITSYRTTATIHCSGLVNCKRSANRATILRNNALSGGAGGVKSPPPKKRGPAWIIRFLRVQVYRGGLHDEC